jgi:TRAP-type C4-dicarboxylate transport system permease small subunit
MFTSKLGARGQCVMAAIGALAGMCFFAIICYGASDGALHAFMANEFEGEGALRVPVWPAKFVLVLGTFLASVSYFLMVIQHIAHGLRGDLPEQYSSSH